MNRKLLEHALDTLDWIANVYATDYEYQTKARETLNALEAELAMSPEHLPRYITVGGFKPSEGGGGGGATKPEQGIAIGIDDPCPQCQRGFVCRTPKCGRLQLPVDHPYRSREARFSIMNRELLKEALYLIEAWQRGAYADEYFEIDGVIDAINAELAKPVAKHVCNLWINPETSQYEVDRCTHPINEVIPVYTAPPTQKLAESEPVAEVHSFVGSDHAVIRVLDMGALHLDMPLYVETPQKLTNFGQEPVAWIDEGFIEWENNHSQFWAEKNHGTKLYALRSQVIAELRRLHEVNQELLEALHNLCKAADNGHVADYSNLWDEARAAIAKATGEST